MWQARGQQARSLVEGGKSWVIPLDCPEGYPEALKYETVVRVRVHPRTMSDFGQGGVWITRAVENLGADRRQPCLLCGDFFLKSGLLGSRGLCQFGLKCSNRGGELIGHRC